MSLGTPEIIVCLLIALIVLGPDQLPKAARQAGKAIAEFKKFSAGMQSQMTDLINADEEAEPKEAPKPPNPNTEGFKLIGDSPLDGPAPSTAADNQTPVETRDLDRDYVQTGNGPEASPAPKRTAGDDTDVSDQG